MADNYIGIKVPPELRAQIIDSASAEGVSVSEWIRALIHNALTGGVPSIEEGYKQARGLAAQMASVMIYNASKQLPATYEEFLARYDFAEPTD